MKNTLLKSISKKNNRRKFQLKKIYQEIDSEREMICESCGAGGVPLSHSHLIPVSYNKNLECVKENIKLHCMSIGRRKGCHEKWESHNLEQMKQCGDFEENMEVIKKLNRNYYNLFVNF